MSCKNVVSWNTLIGRYIRLGNVEAARRVFYCMIERDAVSWNSMTDGCVYVRDYAGALELFSEMQSDGEKPTEVTLMSILGDYAETGALEIGHKIHESLKACEHNIEGYLGLAVHGYCEEVFHLFSDMEESLEGSIKPNGLMFTIVLVSCSHKGLVDKARWYSNHMVKKYEIMPNIKRYGCMVDLLSRWGLLEEAYHMIKNSLFQNCAMLWNTLLGACRTQGNMELAKISFQQLAKLEKLIDGVATETFEHDIDLGDTNNYYGNVGFG